MTLRTRFSLHTSSISYFAVMNGPDAFRRFAQQLQKASSQGGGPKLPSGKGMFAGGGAIVALIGGGILLNASLFNGALYSFFAKGFCAEIFV